MQYNDVDGNINSEILNLAINLLKYTLVQKKFPGKNTSKSPLQPSTANKPNTFNVKNQYQEPKFY